MFRGPADGHVGPRHHGDAHHVEHVEGERANLHEERPPRVARPGDRAEQDVPRAGEQQRRQHHVQRRHGGLDEGQVVRVYPQHDGREQEREREQRHEEAVAQPDGLPACPHHVLLLARPYQVADQRAVGGGESRDGHEEERGDAPHDVRHRQRPFPEVFHGDEEEEPRGGRQEVLDHGPHRHVEDASQRLLAQPGTEPQGVLPPVHLAADIEGEEKHRHPLGHRRGDGRPGYAQLRHAQLPEYQRVVQHHVRPHHHQRVQRQYLGLGGGHEEGPEHHRHEREEEAVHPPAQVVVRGGAHLRRLYHPLQDAGRERLRHREYHRRQQQQERRPLPEHRPDGRVVALPVAPGHQNLRPHAEPEPEHENRHVVHPGQRRGSQLDFAHPPEEGRVRQVNHVLHEHGDQDGVSDVPNLLVRVSHNRSVLRKRREGNQSFPISRAPPADWLPARTPTRPPPAGAASPARSSPAPPGAVPGA